MAVVLSLNSLAALITIKAGLVIKSCAFRIRYVEASDIEPLERHWSERQWARVTFLVSERHCEFTRRQLCFLQCQLHDLAPHLVSPSHRYCVSTAGQRMRFQTCFGLGD